MLAPDLLGFWYLAVATVVSLYQAYRGFMFQWILGIPAVKGTRRRVILLCLADMFTYFVCTASGFLALLLLYQLSLYHSYIGKAEGDTTLQIFLALYGVLGVTGKLPDLLPRIKIPKVSDE